MARTKTRALKRLETRSTKSKQKKSELEKNLKHIKKRQNDPVKKENSDDIKKVAKQEETVSDAASESNSIISSSEDSIDYRLSPRMKKLPKTTTTDFAKTMNKLLATPIEPLQTPVLSRSKGIERQIDETKLEYRARKAINMEKKKLSSKDRVKAELTSIDYERKLRKLATKGVVQLFNAIRQSQKITDDAVKAVGDETKLTTRAARDVADMSKETFLDYLKGGN